jgi:type II secretory pathway pseudopilin PulG
VLVGWPVVGWPFVGVPVEGGAAVVPFSMTVATISTSPFRGTVVVAGKIVITVPPGASSGILSHAENVDMSPKPAASASATRAARLRREACVNIGDANNNTLMGLRGQRGQHGYAMAALLVALGVMLVLMTAALPAWRFQARREKEAELVFRGEQIARGIYLYQRKNGPGAFPPNLDVLLQGRFIRKKYKDPMTKDGEFQMLLAGVNPQAQGRGNQPGPQPQITGINQPGIIGVQSKSKEASIRVYQGRTRYNEWQFNSQNLAARMGGPGRGGRGIGPDGRPIPGGVGGRRGMPGGGRGTPGMPGMPAPGTPRPGGRGPGAVVRPPGG